LTFNLEAFASAKPPKLNVFFLSRMPYINIRIGNYNSKTLKE